MNVALRKESVDRNFNAFGVRYRHIVALRKESVDRNRNFIYIAHHLLVALRKESVDRNCLPQKNRLPVLRRSPQGERG